MTIALWVVLGVALLAIAVLALVLAAALRAIDDLRARVVPTSPLVAVEDAGLSLGASAPRWEAPSLQGGTISSETLAGVTHLVVVAHPGCRPCAELVPALIGQGSEGGLPRTVIISQAVAEEHPASWFPENGRVMVVLDPDRAITERFRAPLAPYAFVIDAKGRVAARGIVPSVTNAHELVMTAGVRGQLEAAETSERQSGEM